MKLNKEQKRITKNLRSWYDTKYIDAGTKWYKDARTFCINLANEYDITCDKVVGVVSALSVGVSWDVNKRQATALIAAFYHVGNIDGVTLSTYKTQTCKALNILK